MTPPERRQALAAGLRAAVTGAMTTLGRVRQLEEAVARSSVEDRASVVETILMDAVDALLLHRQRPCTRERLEKAARLAVAPVAAHGEIGGGHGRHDNVRSDTADYGNAATYTLRRLKRDRPRRTRQDEL